LIDGDVCGFVGKGLRTLELRNMYLDTNDLEELPNVTSLTLRCIKVTDRALTEINEAMPALETMALVSVFGVQEAKIVSSRMKVLCLGLSTSARVVDLDLPRVEKLQLKMTCPELLRVCAPNLMYVAVCMEKREGAHVEFEQVREATATSVSHRLIFEDFFLKKNNSSRENA
jgi:hypothetical protein